MELTFLTLIPSLLAIFLALKTKNVTLSLFGGIVLGMFILCDFSLPQTASGTFFLFSNLLSTPWILKTLAFAILVGSIIEVIEQSRSIDGFVDFLAHKNNYIDSPKKALLTSYLIGVVIFIESSISSLIAGAIGKPLCDKEEVSREKLAFVCDSTSAPVSSLILLNGWGALLLGLLATQVQNDALDLLLASIPYNLYAFAILVVTLLFILFRIEIGSIKHSQPRKASFIPGSSDHIHPLFMFVPIFMMVLGVFLFLYLTGKGDILKGSGSSSIFYTTLTTLVFMAFLYIPTKKLSFFSFFKATLRGAKKLAPIALVLLFAFAIGKVSDELKTGLYLAELAHGNVASFLLPALIFVLASVMSFTTGTSWGTFSIMIPIAIPMGLSLGADLPLLVGAVVSGGVFGDHCSPISDTTIISSLASECDVIDHVRTQLPYALIAGSVALALFVVTGYVQTT